MAQIARRVRAAGSKSMGISKAFIAFISKGNVVELAVGLILGNAFSAIVTSLVKDIITPLMALSTKGSTFSERFFLLQGKSQSYATIEEATKDGAISTIKLTKQ